MNQKTVEIIDIEKSKELFEYEMTEVILMLKGEFASVSGKDMASSQHQVSDEALMAPLAVIQSGQLQSLQVQSSPISVDVPACTPVWKESGSHPQTAEAQAAGDGSVVFVKPDILLPDLQPLNIAPSIPSVQPQTGAQVAIPALPTVAVQPLPGIACEKPNLQLPAAAVVSVEIPQVPVSRSPIAVPEISHFSVSIPAVDAPSVQAEFPAVKTGWSVDSIAQSSHSTAAVPGGIQISVPDAPVVSLPALTIPGSTIPVPEVPSFPASQAVQVSAKADADLPAFTAPEYATDIGTVQVLFTPVSIPGDAFRIPEAPDFPAEQVSAPAGAAIPAFTAPEFATDIGNAKVPFAPVSIPGNAIRIPEVPVFPAEQVSAPAGAAIPAFTAPGFRTDIGTAEIPFAPVSIPDTWSHAPAKEYSPMAKLPLDHGSDIPVPQVQPHNYSGAIAPVSVQQLPSIAVPGKIDVKDTVEEIISASIQEIE